MRKPHRRRGGGGEYPHSWVRRETIHSPHLLSSRRRTHSVASARPSSPVQVLQIGHLPRLPIQAEISLFLQKVKRAQVTQLAFPWLWHRIPWVAPTPLEGSSNRSPGHVPDDRVTQWPLAPGNRT